MQSGPVRCPQSVLQNLRKPDVKMDYLQYDWFADKNGKNYMEDRHFVFKHQKWFVAGVCDGHGGEVCSDFAAEELPRNLTVELDKQFDQDTALRRAIRATDRDLCATLVGRWKKAGTTAVISLISSHEIVTAWVGDSQAVLVRTDTEPLPLVTMHRCTNEREVERIKRAGGTVTFHKGSYRLNGALCVSRSLGDTEYRPGLSAEPDVTHTPLLGTEEYLILGSDGFFDRLSLQSIQHSVYLSYTRHDRSLDHVCEDLFTRAKNAGASDNITIITVFFTDQLSAPYESEDELSRMSRLSHYAQFDDESDERMSDDESNFTLSSLSSEDSLYDLRSDSLVGSKVDEVSSEIDAASSISGVAASESREDVTSPPADESELAALEETSTDAAVFDTFSDAAIGRSDEDVTSPSSRPLSPLHDLHQGRLHLIADNVSQSSESIEHDATPESQVPSSADATKAEPKMPAPIVPVVRKSTMKPIPVRSVEFVNPGHCLPLTAVNRPASGVRAPTSSPVAAAILTVPLLPPLPEDSPYCEGHQVTLRSRRAAEVPDPKEPRPPTPCTSAYKQDVYTKWQRVKPDIYNQWQRVPRKSVSLPAFANHTALPLKKVSIGVLSDNVQETAEKKAVKGYPPSSVLHNKSTPAQKVVPPRTLMSVSSIGLAPRERRSSGSRQLQVHSYDVKAKSPLPPVEGVGMVPEGGTGRSRPATREGGAACSREASKEKITTCSRQSSQERIAARRCASCSKQLESSDAEQESLENGDVNPDGKKKKKNIFRKAMKHGRQTGHEMLKSGRKAMKAGREVLRTKVVWVGTHINRLSSAVSRKNRVHPTPYVDTGKVS